MEELIKFHFLSRDGEATDKGVPITIRIKYQDDLVIDEEYENNFYCSSVKSFMTGYEGIRKHI